MTDIAAFQGIELRLKREEGVEGDSEMSLPQFGVDGPLGRGLVVNYEQLLVTGGKCPLLRGPEMARHWSYSCLTTSCCCITDLPSQVLILLRDTLPFSDQSQPGSTASLVTDRMLWCHGRCC